MLNDNLAKTLAFTLFLSGFHSVASNIRVWTTQGTHNITSSETVFGAQLTEDDQIIIEKPLGDSFDNNSTVGKMSAQLFVGADRLNIDYFPLNLEYCMCLLDANLYNSACDRHFVFGWLKLRTLLAGERVPLQIQEVVSVLWPNATVPYAVDASLKSDSARYKAINAAIDLFHKLTCVQFLPRLGNETDFVRFMDGGIRKTTCPFRCYSYVGRVGGSQELSIGAGCERRIGVVLHEMMHALGFVHEQSRPDRDLHVEVLWDAIKPKQVKNFRKFESTEFPETFENLDVLPYDYASLLHYHSTAFTRNGHRTIVTIDERAQHIIGQREGFSDCDLVKIYELYGCNNLVNVSCKNAERPAAACADVHPSCATDVARDARLCDDAPGIYRRFCAFSCARCQPTGVTCADSRRYAAVCAVVARQPRRYCAGEPTLNIVCPRACRVC